MVVINDSLLISRGKRGDGWGKGKHIARYIHRLYCSCIALPLGMHLQLPSTPPSVVCAMNITRLACIDDPFTDAKGHRRQDVGCLADDNQSQTSNAPDWPQRWGRV